VRQWQRATVATPGEWQCGVRRLAVANGPNIFQMLLVLRPITRCMWSSEFCIRWNFYRIDEEEVIPLRGSHVHLYSSILVSWWTHCAVPLLTAFSPPPLPSCSHSIPFLSHIPRWPRVALCCSAPLTGLSDIDPRRASRRRRRSPWWMKPY